MISKKLSIIGMKYHLSNSILGSKYKFNKGIYFITKNNFIEYNNDGLGNLLQSSNLSGGEKIWPFYLKDLPTHKHDQHIYVSII